jgi:hypothetical protein
MFKIKIISLMSLVLFTSHFANASRVSPSIKADVVLARENIVIAQDSNSCSLKANILGQVYMLAHMIKNLSQEDFTSYGPNVFPLATILESYGINSRVEDPCASNTQSKKMTKKSFVRTAELLGELSKALDFK